MIWFVTPAVVNAEEKIELCKRLLEMCRMHLALIIKPIENGFGEVTLCDDILLSVVKRTAFVTTIWRCPFPTAKPPVHKPFRAYDKDAFVGCDYPYPDL